MRRTPLKRWWSGIAIVLVCVSAAGLLAQVATNPPPAQASAFPPMPPPVKSPVTVFQELLAMTPGERRLSLSNRPPELREKILAKVAEYESLAPSQRQLRLQATELRWYLWPLMSVSATNRVAALARVPEGFRDIVTERLQEWDRLSPELQSEIRDKEATLRYFTELEGSTEEQRNRILANLTPERRQQLEEGVAQWRAMPEAQQRRALEQFERFFGLNQQQRQRALGTLSEPERRKIENTIAGFARLSSADRARCLRALGQFAEMSLQERQEFLSSAERWKQMPPDKREEWTRLVNAVTRRPPVPPGLDSPPLPPMPQRPTRSPAVATNGGG